MPTFSFIGHNKSIHLISTHSSIYYLFRVLRVCNPKHPEVVILQALPVMLHYLNQSPGPHRETNNQQHMQTSWIPAEHRHTRTQWVCAHSTQQRPMDTRWLICHAIHNVVIDVPSYQRLCVHAPPSCDPKTCKERWCNHGYKTLERLSDTNLLSLSGMICGLLASSETLIIIFLNNACQADGFEKGPCSCLTIKMIEFPHKRLSPPIFIPKTQAAHSAGGLICCCTNVVCLGFRNSLLAVAAVCGFLVAAVCVFAVSAW